MEAVAPTPTRLRCGSVGMNQRLVSIVIPCWNGESFVADAIESALAQTYPNIEVIVVDDGSTDGTVGVLKSFGERIRWETTPNRGACAARNRGAEIANGDILQFLDADDALMPRKLERTAALVSSDGLAPICGCETTFEDGATRIILPSRSPSDALDYALTNQIQTSAIAHHRTWFWRVGGFLAGLPCGQERDLHIRLAAVGLRFVQVYEPLTNVRRRPGSISSNTHRVLLQHEATFLRARDILAERSALTDAAKAALARAFVRDARHLVRRGDRAAAQRYADHARALHVGGGVEAFGSTASQFLARTLGVVPAENLIQSMVRSLRGVGGRAPAL